MKPYSIFFISFLVVTAIERICTTFFVTSKYKGIVFERWTLYPLVFFHILIYIFCAIEYFFSYRKINPYVVLLGLILFILSFLLRKWSVKTLGEYESCHIEIKLPHKIIQQGPYKYLRNPRYIANMIEVISITLIANAYMAFIFALITYIPFTMYRAAREDKVMCREIGKDYINYRRKVNF